MTLLCQLILIGCPNDENRKIIPKLTLSGNWLQKAGFLPYEIIYVKVEEGRLVITSYQPTE